MSKIQRAWDKAWEWADIKFSKKILLSKFAEGGTLTQWKAEKLQKRVKEMWQEQQKAQFFHGSSLLFQMAPKSPMACSTRGRAHKRPQTAPHSST